MVPDEAPCQVDGKPTILSPVQLYLRKLYKHQPMDREKFSTAPRQQEPTPVSLTSVHHPPSPKLEPQPPAPVPVLINKRGPKVKCFDRANVRRRQKNLEKKLDLGIRAVVSDVLGPDAPIDRAFGQFFRSPTGKRTATKVNQDLCVADTGHKITEGLKKMLRELPKSHSRFKACLVRKLLGDVDSNIVTRVFDIKASYHRNSRRGTTEQLQADSRLLSEKRSKPIEVPQWTVPDGVQRAAAEFAKRCMVQKSGYHTERLHLLQRLETVYELFQEESKSGRLYVTALEYDPAMRWKKGSKPMTVQQRNIELSLIKAAQDGGDDADVTLPVGWENYTIKPLGSQTFWEVVERQGVKFTRVHKPWFCQVCDRQASLVRQLENVKEELRFLTVDCPERVLLVKRGRVLERKVERGKLHNEQKLHQRPYAAQIMDQLKEGEAVVVEDFVAHYNIWGEKIVNLILTVKWKEGDVVKTKYLDNYCSDQISNREDHYFPRHVWDFHLSKDGSGELSRFKKIFRNGDSGPHFINQHMMWWWGTVYETYGIEIDFNTLPKRHAWNECDGEGGRTTTFFRREALAGNAPVTAKQCADSLNNSDKFASSAAYWFAAINHDPALFPGKLELRDMEGIQKMSEFSFFHFDADHKVARTAGVVRARPLSGKGDWQTWDLLRRKGVGWYCVRCTIRSGRAIHHPKRGCKIGQPPPTVKASPANGGQGPGQSVAGAAALAEKSKIDKSVRICRSCELVKKHDKCKRSCQDCWSAKASGKSQAKRKRKGTTKAIAVTAELPSDSGVVVVTSSSSSSSSPSPPQSSASSSPSTSSSLASYSTSSSSSSSSSSTSSASAPSSSSPSPPPSSASSSSSVASSSTSSSSSSSQSSSSSSSSTWTSAKPAPARPRKRGREPVVGPQSVQLKGKPRPRRSGWGREEAEGQAEGEPEEEVKGQAHEEAEGHDKSKEIRTSNRRGQRSRRTYVALEPVEIVDERWWPENGPEPFTQRVCEVRFGDGSVEQVLAEDLDGRVPLDDPLIEQNGLYAAVLEAWRGNHLPPPHPDAATDEDDDSDSETVDGRPQASRPPPNIQLSSGDESEYVDAGDMSLESSDSAE
jgi:hypothetical protein